MLHSLLATNRAKAAFAHRYPGCTGHYRLLYNALAILLLLPVATLVTAVPGPILWSWRGVPGGLRDGLTLLALGVAYFAGRGYQLRPFLFGPPAGHREPLVISSVHRYVRHPWYTCGLLLVWTRDMDVGTLISALAITAYLVIGSRLEDRKLVGQYGDAYRDFQARVPGLIPWPHRSMSVSEADALLARANALPAAAETR